MQTKYTNQTSLCLDPHLNLGRDWCRETGLSPPVIFFTGRSKAVLLLWIMSFVSCVYYAFVCASVY